MKPGGPLARKTPLQNRTPLQPGIGLTRRNPLPRGGSEPARRPLSSARPKVSSEERRARELVKARADQRCEGCGVVGPTEYAHRVGRAQGGPWCPSNAMALCSQDHRWCHANPAKARDLGWLLRSTDDPLVVPAVMAWRGWFLLTPDGDAVPTERTAL